MIDFKALAAPFPPDRISWRVGSTTQDKKKGMALAYIDARDVMERLDATCGPAGWQCRYPHAAQKTVCAIGIRCGEEWVWKEDGAGDSDVEAEKGAMSDAFKRAAVKWGIGRYLYDVASPWVALEAAGRSYKIADSELPKLHALLRGGAPSPTPKPPAPAVIPSTDASAGVWQDFAKAKVAAALKLMSTDGLGMWQDANKDALDAIKKKSVKLHEWVGQQITEHHNKLAEKEAA